MDNEFYCFFKTVIGICALAWRSNKITRLVLPEKTKAETEARVLVGISKGIRVESLNAPAWIQKSLHLIEKHLKTGKEDLQKISIDLSGSSAFCRQVYRATQEVPAGKVFSYKQIAEKIGLPSGARAVGQALGKNPFPLLVPCHRIVSCRKGMGGFSAGTGVQMKEALLRIENPFFNLL